eukprot:CAMPEP_0185765856 /NCGR_PEP_ID=MMETSP1174-20130828/33114_1 /TAXON_ID=35687 /ORGANISM="Dictyocha speculum, Strain CCMP1381" /LENGTH=60 /DNA_ID=CAMNT_0028449253 /DNA_START=23 /DNA_END=205 /DNA_ORIENTATION=+
MELGELDLQHWKIGVLVCFILGALIAGICICRDRRLRDDLTEDKEIMGTQMTKIRHEAGI